MACLLDFKMITYHQDTKLFHLRNPYLSCFFLLRADDEGHEELLMPYLGAPLPLHVNPVLDQDWHEHASFDLERQSLPYCVPTEGRGDFRPAMIAARDEAGYATTELYYTGTYQITAGKPALPGLPATYVEAENEAETLSITLADPVSGLTVTVSYTLFANLPVLTASAAISNHGTEKLTLENAASFTLPLMGRYEMIHLHGAWAKECQVERVPAATLTRTTESVRGASGHEHNPFVALATPETTEHAGECYGICLVYSGDFRISTDENAFGTTRLVAGLNPRTLRWQLNPGDSFQTPEAVCVYSNLGFNGMSQTFHTLFRTRLVRGPWRDRERPILINNWEATYFQFDHNKILKIAKAAAKLGVELFVLDDGWFGKRDTDHCSLGDWVTNTEKLPQGLDGLGKDINNLGMRFGLWFEPEMISPDSDLYRAHPDWCLHVGNRRRTQARHQLTLDMSRQDVQDYVIESVSKVLRSAPIGYVKWDMNRNFAEAGSALLANGRGGELRHRYMLGVYRVMDAITSAFPEVLFESCSGGGGRFDAGILYYMPQTWTSDDTDAIERLRIQYGTSFCYPTSAMGAHVSAVPNHQIGRVTSMKMRGDVALGGNFGYELDLSAQTEEDLQVIAQQIALIKQIRKTTQQGVFTRLSSPFEGNITAWQFVDNERIVLCMYRTLAQANPAALRIKLHNLPMDAIYRSENGDTYSAAQLMYVGIEPQFPKGDFASQVLIFSKQ